MSNPALPQGFIDGFQVQLTANVAPSDQTIFFPTAGMVNGFKYHMRIDDTSPPSTFEYIECTVIDSGSVKITSPRGSIGGTAAAQHNAGVNSGWVTCVILLESLQGVFARVDQINSQAFAASSQISGLAFAAYGLPGAVQPSRYAGATTGGAPTTGTFAVGDFVLDSVNNVILLCITAGSPGTWVNLLDGTNTGLASAVSSLTRWVGATGGGAPTSGTWKQGDVITDRAGTLWVCTAPGTPGTWRSLPMGALAYSQAVAAQVGINAVVDLTNCSVTVTVPAGRRLNITGYCHAIVSTVANDVAVMYITDGSNTILEDGRSAPLPTGNGPNLCVQVIDTPPAGTKTYKLRAQRQGGTGTLTFDAGAQSPMWIQVTDIGT